MKRSREDYEPSPSPEHTDSCSDTASVRIVAVPSKIQHIENLAESGEPSSTSTADMKCSLPPHKQTLSFPTFEEYEIHYAKEHTNRCLECRKNFPTVHFLNLHIEENHDSLVAVRRERGEKTYQCFVTDCDKVCSTPQKRRMHLIAKHAFPNEYDFYIVNDGIDRRSSMLKSGRHRRGSSAAVAKVEKTRRRAETLEHSEGSPKRPIEEEDHEHQHVAMQVDSSDNLASVQRVNPHPSTQQDPIDELVGGMSALKFVPPSVRFGRGRGRGRGGFSKT